MHATCLELLREHLHPGARVLDVGSGEVGGGGSGERDGVWCGSGNCATIFCESMLLASVVSSCAAETCNLHSHFKSFHSTGASYQHSFARFCAATRPPHTHPNEGHAPWCSFAGSGYLTSAMAVMVGDAGKVNRDSRPLQLQPLPF